MDESSPMTNGLTPYFPNWITFLYYIFQCNWLSGQIYFFCDAMHTIQDWREHGKWVQQPKDSRLLRFLSTLLGLHPNAKERELFFFHEKRKDIIKLKTSPQNTSKSRKS